MKKAVLLLVACGLVFSGLVLADDLSEVKNIVSKNITIVIDLVRDKKLDKPTRNKKIIETVTPFFDFEFMAKVCLGKTHWDAMNAAQQKEYIELFVKRLQDSYLEKLDLYTDEEVVVDEAKQVDKRIYVITHLVTKKDKMEMIYKFRETKQDWLVYDMELLGVSIVQTYRSQFAGFLKNHTVSELLTNLRTSGSLEEPAK